MAKTNYISMLLASFDQEISVLTTQMEEAITEASESSQETRRSAGTLSSSPSIEDKATTLDRRISRLEQFSSWLKQDQYLRDLIDTTINKGVLIPLSEREKKLLNGEETDQVNGKGEEGKSILRVYITEEPLTAYNLATVISSLTELFTKCWLMQQNRFSDLIEYAQTRDIRFIKEADLTIGKLTHNSPALIDLLVGPASIASTATLALALKIAIDAIVQTPLRFKATKLDTQKKELEVKTQEQVMQQKLQTAKQQTELERQKNLLEIEKQQFEVEKQRLELERNRVEVTLEIASKMVDALRPGVDEATKGMLIQSLLPNLLQLGTTNGLENVLNAHKQHEE